MMIIKVTIRQLHSFTHTLVLLLNGICVCLATVSVTHFWFSPVSCVSFVFSFPLPSNSTYLQYYMNRLQAGDWAAKVQQWSSCPSTEPSPYGACSQTWAGESVVLACSTAETDQNGDKIVNGFDLEVCCKR